MMNMQIAEYRNANDIDVLFDNGTVKKHTTYEWFKKQKNDIQHGSDEKSGS